MNITNCYYAGIHKRLTDDWTGTLETTAVMALLTGLWFGISASYAIEGKIQRAVTRVEKALLTAEANHPGRFQAEFSLRIGEQTLEKIRRVRCVLLTITAVVSVPSVLRYCEIGCPGFDVWSEMRSQFRQILPSIPGASYLSRNSTIF